MVRSRGKECSSGLIRSLKESELVWRSIPVISVLRRLRQEAPKFKVRPGLYNMGGRKRSGEEGRRKGRRGKWRGEKKGKERGKGEREEKGWEGKALEQYKIMVRKIYLLT
jgi:hypothetical protein